MLERVGRAEGVAGALDHGELLEQRSSHRQVLVERALGAEPCVYVSNHLSMVDILAAFAIRLRYRWVSKFENFLVPFLGWNMALNGYVRHHVEHAVEYKEVPYDSPLIDSYATFGRAFDLVHADGVIRRREYDALDAGAVCGFEDTVRPDEVVR